MCTRGWKSATCRGTLDTALFFFLDLNNWEIREQGIYDQAITAFEAVLKHQKTNPHALQNLAQLHAHTGNITKVSLSV